MNISSTEIEYIFCLEKKEEINTSVNKLIDLINNSKTDLITIEGIKENRIQIEKKYIIQYLEQILDSKTIQRSKYYIDRLKKSLVQTRNGSINDLNLNRWKELDDIKTDSLWLIDKRDNSGVHNSGYWGNFIPQIPYQFIKRYTKKGDWVLDPFLGCGTTLIEAQRLGRNGLGIEIQEKIANISKVNIEKERNLFSEQVNIDIEVGDSACIDFNILLSKNQIKNVQLAILHPPYWDIIKFSDDKKDLSNSSSLEEFLNAFRKVIINIEPIIENKRYMALVIGDKYSNGEWIPLGFYTMQEVLKSKFTLKSIIVKNFMDTKGKRNQQELWRYRALVGGFYIFKHEYIFLFRKKA